MNTLWKKQLQHLKEMGLLRQMRISGPGPIEYSVDGEKLIFCSNDYLGLATHPEVTVAASPVSHHFGAGASRLVSGNCRDHERLEKQFAGFVEKEASVLFPSGYQANVGTVSALTDADDVIFSDERSHASLIDGCRLSKATVEIFNHNDTAHLETLLKKYNKKDCVKLIITEGIFSMDGDTPPLSTLCELKKKYNAALYLDEAHSLGIIGTKGKGLASQLNVLDEIDILVGTFGKAFGVCGAAVACSSVVAQLIKSKARSLLYTTAPPPSLSSAVLKSMDLITRGDHLRDTLHTNISYFKERAKKANLNLLHSDTPIQPIVIGEAKKTMEISATLWDQGIFVQGIRPPTVKPGTERLRITLTAKHTHNQIDLLIDKLIESGIAS